MLSGRSNSEGSHASITVTEILRSISDLFKINFLINYEKKGSCHFYCYFDPLKLFSSGRFIYIIYMQNMRFMEN